MNSNARKTRSIATALVLPFFCTTTQAQGLMPVPNIAGATIETEAVLATGPAWGGRYEYRYTINSPSSTDGKIWLLKVDVSAEERSSTAFPRRTYPVQGGTQFLRMIDEIELLAPFDGENGSEVVIVDQLAPSGWNGGINVQGFAFFAAADTTFAITPGSSSAGFTMGANRPPTIRLASITPHWILAVEDEEQVTEQDMVDALTIEKSLPVSTFVLGPLDIDIGGWQHYSQLFTDTARAEFLGWATDTNFVNTIELAIGNAQSFAFEGNNGLALAELQSVFTTFAAADPTTFRPEFRQLVELNVAALIQILPSAFNTFIAVFEATPEEAELELGDTFTLAMRHFNSALENNPPIEGLRVLIRCVGGFQCANIDSLSPGTAFRIDETGQVDFSYVGQNIGVDFIEVVENDNEGFRQLALIEVNWSAAADLVVPAFVPPVILAGEGNTIFVSDRTSNIGNADATVSTITRYYISNDDPIDITTATVLGERSVGPLAKQAADDSFEVEYVIPQGFNEEVHFLAACADDDQEIIESDEENNCSFSEVARQFDAVAVEPDIVIVLPKINIAGAIVEEGDVGQQEILFNVSITAPDPSNDIVASIRSIDGTATAGIDYVLSLTDVVFAAGTIELVQAIPVTVFGDFDVENDEAFTIELFNVSANAVVEASSASGVIENDDLVAVMVGDVSKLEGDSGNTPFVFVVSIDQAHPTESVLVALQTTDGSAVVGADYLSAAPIVSFDPATVALSQNVSIDVVGDTVVEANETFTLDIGSVSANAIALDAVGLATIQNDDSPPELDCTLATASPNSLWPPNHKLVSISIGGVFGLDGSNTNIVVTGIEQDELVDGEGDGNTSPDGFDVGTDSPQVRRERSGLGDGRIYFIAFDASDVSSSATCSGSVAIGVPHDQGQGFTPIDSGVRYDSTVP